MKLKYTELLRQRNELLEALQTLIGDIEREPVKFSKEEKINIARSAIKKAKNEK